MAVTLLIGTIIDITANVVPLPQSWRAHLWIAWLVLAAALVGLIVVSVLERCNAERSPSVPPPGPAVRQDIIAAGPGAMASGAINGNVVHHHHAPLPPAKPDAEGR
ncbi:hypothetical protein [Micromonospora sp. NPDC005806]|uniref:hypothetical protein n=1 Tax=Micromonospora sp. NPDC005806 TaxID=3364234 RepID=UPI003675335E